MSDRIRIPVPALDLRSGPGGRGASHRPGPGKGPGKGDGTAFGRQGRLRRERPMRDGVVLSANVFRPDAPGRFPVIVVRTPYGKSSASHFSLAVISPGTATFM